MNDLKEYFGCNVFDDKKMKESLSPETYVAFKKIVEEGAELSEKIANEIAKAMKDWAISKGATHFTHWFQPLTGITAEKHDSFLSKDENGIIMDFSGKELIKGEADASSFPSGGLRATFEARGYTTWDPSSYAFIKGKTLCIPTAFCSYNGEALDKKTPLLRSMDVISKAATRLLNVIGYDEVTKVTPMVGAEQEYFLVPQELYDKRIDLRFAGRTLFGSMSPKGQEMDDHYYGTIKQEVLSFMEELNVELWKLGVYAKTEHNEVAPSQHELACIYSTANVSVDQNQLVMETMKKIAAKHNIVCLLHEKPFKGVNGSGKHNNWSLETNTGMNMLSPGKEPQDNLVFLLTICAIMKGVDDYQDLLRISVATPNNDHRLGANEAPPAVISLFLGDEVTGIFDAIENDVPYKKNETVLMDFGVETLAEIKKDVTDRNRTTPMAFTGNKFEFRMPGSSDSIACANVMLNTAVADAFLSFADELEGKADMKKAINELIKKVIKEHKRIIFNGNGYDDNWINEAERRGLLNLKTTVDAVARLLDKKNVDMLTKHGVYTEKELKARFDTTLENYAKIIKIEARTMVFMATKQIAPAIEKYTTELAGSIIAKKSVNSELKCGFETSVLNELSCLVDGIWEDAKALDMSIAKVSSEHNMEDAILVRDEIIPSMDRLRDKCDKAEKITSKEFWPFPGYEDLLFGTK